MEAVARHLDGQLTATMHGTPEDLKAYASLVSILEGKAGRVIVNGFPTGVEVCASMQHGGPYPATTDSRTTSVGTAAIHRFARPVAIRTFHSRCCRRTSGCESARHLAAGRWRDDEGRAAAGRTSGCESARHLAAGRWRDDEGRAVGHRRCELVALARRCGTVCPERTVGSVLAHLVDRWRSCDAWIKSVRGVTYSPAPRTQGIVAVREGACVGVANPGSGGRTVLRRRRRPLAARVAPVAGKSAQPR